MKRALIAALILASGLTAAAQGRGQGRGNQPPAPPPTPQQAAPFDVTGTWVSVITEDWRWRMVTPARGDYQSIPITAAAKAAADAWNPARDQASGQACKGYGLPGVMRLPTRLRIAWQDAQTLQVETDHGQQTRLLRFDPAARAAAPSLQGHSVAAWELAARGRGAPPDAPRFGNLKIVTTNLAAGYLRKNGVPYSADAQVTEYWDVARLRNGDQWLVVTMIVHDPANLQVDWITSLNFKK
ncbi:MAG: hypothetical protein AB7P99_08515, partial [Vicinamibacterales bacterium]